MTVTRHTDPDQFLAAALPLMAANPATKAFIAMFVAGWRRNPAEIAGGYAATYARGGAHGMALCGRHRSVVLENSAPSAARAFAEDIPGTLRDLRSVVGERAACEAFAEGWCARFGGTYREGMGLRHHRLTEVHPVPLAPGGMRIATEADSGWLTEGSLAFIDETHIPDPRDTVMESVQRRVAAGRFRIWEDRARVAFAAWSEGGPEAARIAPVYTVREARRRGYATALTAALARELLANGRREIFLMTDLANPTSNAIYARVGFRPVSDVWRLDLVPA